MKKSLYMIQPNIRFGNSVYLPYAAGVIAANALASPIVCNRFELADIFFLREDTDEVLSKMKAPDVVGFSCYIWNTEYNLLLAGKIKEKYPDCVIIFGGHNVDDGSGLLEKYPFIDFLIHGEGEEAFAAILESVELGLPFENISNISFRDESGSPVNNPREALTAAVYPSPYSAGIFDSLVSEHPEIKFSAIFETNRGCPYGCAFCDWCSMGSKIRQLPLERIYSDLKWMAEHKIEFCYCADANFGIVERDEQIIDELIRCREKYGYPEKFRVNYAKNNNETVYNINVKLNRFGLSKGVTLSFQTMSEQVLKKVGRSNMNINRFSELIKLYNDAHIPTYSELILGLPGETYDSFCSGVGKLIEAGQHRSVLIYNCELLMNTRLADPNYMEENGIRYVVTPLYLRHDIPANEEVSEFSRTVIGSSAMSVDEWIDASMFSALVQSCHGMGLLRYFAIYLNKETGLKYESFYSELCLWCKNNPTTFLGKIYFKIRTEFEKIAAGNGEWSFYDGRFGDVSWPYEEAFYLLAAYSIDSFYSDVSKYLKGFGINDDVFSSLMLYQRAQVKLPGMKDSTASLNYDLPFYFGKAMSGEPGELLHSPVHLYAADSEIPETWPEFAKKYIWFGRKEQENLFEFQQ